MLAVSTACVCAWDWRSVRRTVSWPEPQPDFINQSEKHVQPLKSGLKTLLTVFLWCLLLCLNDLSQFVLSAFFFYVLFSSFCVCCWKMPLSFSFSFSWSAEKVLSLRTSDSSTWISKQCLLKQRAWKVVMIYRIIPVETQELMCLHDSPISSSHYMATDRLMPDASSL